VKCLKFRRVLLPVTQGHGRIKVGTPRDMRRVATHALYSETKIKVGTIIREKNKGDTIKIGPSKMITGEGKIIMRRTILTQVKVQNQKGSASSPRVNDLLSRILDKVEGLDDLMKGMKYDFSSLNNKVNSHADAIKTLEGQLSLFSA